MLPQVAIGKQNFLELRQKNCFYVDKTHFIKDWWNSASDVTLITRPRRFGKTLMLDTVKTFFSQEFTGRSDLFEELAVWKDEKLRNLQGTIPVIFLSFSDIKETKCINAIRQIKLFLNMLYDDFSLILDHNLFSEREKIQFDSVQENMDDITAKTSLKFLCRLLVRQGYAKPIILLDEYDTPLLEAWLHSSWDELINFLRGFFNSTFKTNSWLERGLITGITRVAKESIFSDLNNLQVVSVTSNLYTDCFGFTEQEVFTAMDTYGLSNKAEVKQWYDGFIFGDQHEIYNPWSIINFLATKELNYYWADTSSNALVSDLLAHSDSKVKQQAEMLLKGHTIVTKIDEQIDFNTLYTKIGAIWSLLMTTGYLKPISVNHKTQECELKITNLEAQFIFESKISEWFMNLSSTYNYFLKALLENNISEMNVLMSNIAEGSFSFFDTKGQIKNDIIEAESFYHGFVLGLLINLKDRYTITSNRESGFGRYDICMYPMQKSDPGIVIEFKSINKTDTYDLQNDCSKALKQIKEKHYIKDLLVRNVPKYNIYIYGFVFQGKNVLICGGLEEEIDLMSI